MEYNWVEKQLKVCKQHSVQFLPISDDVIVGVSLINIKDTSLEINGLRNPIEGQTSGWYIWRGEYQETDDFFEPMHLHHLVELAPEVLKFFGLPPGWRFLKHYTHEDVWYDPNLLDVEDNKSE